MLKWIRRVALLSLALAVLLASALWLLLRGSLATLDGEVALPGLSAPVTISRDALGTVTVDAANATDMARALGYVHAQERFFEMDLMRRTSAGELAELFGPVALKLDEQHRAHRIRARVNANLDAFAGDRREQLQAYADGVNAGLAALKVRPWPYLLLRQRPRKWEIADSALVGYAMYFDLQDSQGRNELALWKIRPHLPPALYALLTRDGSAWDAPLMGEPRGDAVLPGAGEVDLRKLPVPRRGRQAELADKAAPGSNDWAVDGTLTKDGRAIVADDMHLSLRAPNIWFRARLRWADARAQGGKVDISGFTLPGLPAVIVGSNGHVAWGFTNGYIDTADWVAVPRDAPGIRTYDEKILVAGRPAEDFKVRESAWGPILAERGDQSLALRWTAQQPGAVSFGFAGLAYAKDIGEAFAVADHAGIPTQNFMVADASGRIGWRLIGTRPQRAGDCDATTVETRACAPWTIASADAPHVLDPPAHRLWTANARTLDGAGLATVGDGGYALGARAKQIRDDLFAKDRFAEKDLLGIQLDDRALFLERWWKLLQSENGKGAALTGLAKAASHWEGRASPESVGYRIVRAWRLAVNARIADGLTAPAQAALGDDFDMPGLQQLEGVAWPLLQQRPANLLSPRYADWDALLEDAAKEVRDDLSRHGPLAQRTWGERNTAQICHPLARALPSLLKSRLCMPADPLDGDTAMPRVVGPAFGASERMVVSPGHEADGIIHMPGGQSGHPLSPFWGAGHEAWVKGEPTPFLPGEAKYALKLEPPH
jgi:penicillin amidase